MVNLVLHGLGVPVWIPFAVWFGGYIMLAGSLLVNGYTRELFGSSLMHIGRIHHVIWRFHTGQHIGTKHSYGDEHNLWRTAGAYGSRSTPAGMVVYYHSWKRWQRALRNNVLLVMWLLIMCGMAIAPEVTVINVTALLVVSIFAWIAYGIHLARKRHARTRPVSRPILTGTRPAKLVLASDKTTIGSRPVLEIEKQPKLEGVSITVLATLLSSRMGCSAAEIIDRLTMTPDKAVLVLPDSFAALIKEREPIQEVIEAHTKGKLRFEWATTTTPRTLSWLPIVEHVLPKYVRFRDHLDHLASLRARECGVGIEADRTPYVASHNGDKPWHCRFAGSGTGKSMGFLVKAAQICHNDPYAEVYGIDTKQVSFEYLHDIPRVHIFDDPQSQMDKIWGVFYELSGIMRDRYTALRNKKLRPDELHDIWIFCDEGNDLAACLKSYYKNVMRETGPPALWGECVGPLLRQGRQARMFGEWMFQDLDGRLFGGETLKPAFGVFGAAGFLPGQFTRTIGSPAEECIEGPGRILMCSGNKRTWVQGYADDENWLHEYALENRKAALCLTPGG